MAEISKLTASITNKNVMQPVKEQRTGDAAAFQFQEIGKVLKMTPQSELLQQNTSNINEQKPAQLLMDLMTDPQVTIGYMRSILFLKEIVALLPMQNQSFTEEIEQLFQSLQLAPEQLPIELVQQENASTAFKGELFDLLRNVLSKNPSPETQGTVLNFLKAVSNETSRSDILNALSGSFTYLAKTMAPSKALSEALTVIARKFDTPEAERNFHEIRQEATHVLQEIEQSILYTTKTEKLVSLIRYNLSRFNDNKEYLGTATNEMMALFPESQKPELLQRLYEHLTRHHQLQQSLETDESTPRSGSQVLNALTKILEKQTENEQIQMLKSDSMEGIVHSLLSSPSNFTPLLHFILPVSYEDVNATAEMWVNPDEESVPDGKGNVPERTIHMLLVFEIENMGRFETELYARDKELSISLLCPPQFTDTITQIAPELRKCVAASDYTVRELNIGKLEKNRTLVDVFPALPEKRVGINVRI